MVCACEKLKQIGGKNYNNREKCAPNMIDLAFKGVDPNEFAFQFDEAALARLKNVIKEGRMISTKSEGAF